jgi:hypothetical protein
LIDEAEALLREFKKREEDCNRERRNIGSNRAAGCKIQKRSSDHFASARSPYSHRSKKKREKASPSRAHERDAGTPNARYMKIQAIISTIEQMMNIEILAGKMNSRFREE